MPAPDPHEYRVLDSELIYEGRIFSLHKDTVAMPGGEPSAREVVRHPGAVAIVALDDEDRVLMLRQYRHPVAQYLWELPPACATSTASRPWRRPSASSPRRPGWPPSSGRC